MKTIKNLTAEQIRKSILQLAIQGKLVKQDPNDEPASELAKRIYEEKHRLIREGKLKKDKNESYIYKGDDNCYYEKVGNAHPALLSTMPSELPEGWTWIRQSNLCWLDNGESSESGQLPYLEARVIRQNKADKFLNSGVVVDSRVKLILVDGENSGEIFTPPFKGYMGSTFKILGVSSQISFEYLLLIFKFNVDLYRNSKTGVAIPHLNKKLFRDRLIALPPIQEQKRIVTKYKKFDMPLNKYEAIERTASQYENTFEEKLKGSILQYAVEGKLVQQDPNDEPASILLEKIKVEKERLIDEGRIKREKGKSALVQTDDNNYYEKNNGTFTKVEIPFQSKYAIWTKLKNIAYITKLAGFEYTKYVSPNLSNTGIPLFKGKNVQNSKIVYQFEDYIPLSISNLLSRSQVNKKCLLTPYVGTIGNIGIHNKEGIYHLGSNVGKIELINPGEKVILEEYIFYYLKSSYGYKQLSKFKKATAQESISIDAIREALVPLYTFNYQSKLVNKISFIFNLISTR